MAADLCISVISGVASKVAESLFDPIRREISYAFKYQSYVEKLRSQLVDLKNRSQRLEQTVNEAKRQGGKIYDDVQQWLDQTTQLIQRADRLINEDEDVAKNKRCFKGLCPNLMSRRKLSKEAVNERNVANDLLGKGNFTNVSYLPPPERTESMNDIRGYQQFDSRKKIFQDVMEVLEDDNVGMIGVHGMGGVGKTTLVKQVAKKVREEKLLFDEVAMVEVTQNPDLKTIQDKIAYDIDFQFPQNESTLYARADRLRQRLKKGKRVLVILDNIWAKLDLEAVGIPSGVHDHRQCTILLTSRSRHVLCNDMNSQKTFSIEVLSNEESMELFWKTVGDDFAQTSDFRPLAVEIVRKCEGLPVAIKTVAVALKNKSLSVWKDALNQLRNSNPRQIHGMTANVYSSIQLSYNFLESADAKSLFRLCALQNDGSQIPINDLVIYGMGFGLFTNRLEEGRNRVDVLIDNLKTSCLLLDGDNEHVVKMHDVIHDVAVSIAAEEHMFNIQDVDDLKEELEKVMQKEPTAISLPHREIQELPERLECPKLEVFLLFAKSKLEGNSLQISDLFFEGMKELRVLHLTSFLSISSSLGCLTNLRTLSLNDFISLEDVAIIGKLTKLQILSFRNSNIKQLPLEIGQLTRLKLLDLSNCRSLEVIAPNVISKLSRLEELLMGNSFTHWEKGEGGSNASLDELKALSKLTTLHVDIPNVRVMPQDLVAVELERYKICIGGDQWGGLDWLNLRTYERVLKLNGLDKSILMGSGMQKFSKNIECLHLLNLNGFQNVVNSVGQEISRTLSATPSASKEIVAEDDREVLFNNKVIFPALEKLELRSINVEKIWLDPFPTMSHSSYQNLTELTVVSCSRLEFLFTYSMVRSLVKLQKLEIEDCESMERVIDTTGFGRDEEQMIDSEVFPKLEYLELSGLPKLARFVSISSSNLEENNILYTGTQSAFFNEKVRLPSLEKLSIEKMENMEKIWLDPFPTMSTYPCQNLTELTVKKCSRLKFLFTYSMVNSLVKLQKLEIEDCESMERVIDTTVFGRDEEQMIDSEVFPKLKHLKLWCLPKLVRFMSMSSSDSEENNILHTGTQSALFNEKVRLPSLEKLSILGMENMEKIWLDPFPTMSHSSYQNLTELTVVSCSRLEFLFTYSVVRSLVKLQKLEIEYCDSMERVIDTTGFERDEEQMIDSEVFPKLEHLNLLALPKLARFVSMSSSNLEENNILHTGTQSTLFNEKIRLPSLEKLSIWGMKNLRKIWQWHPQLAWDSFSKLKELEVCRCNELTSVFSSNIIMGRKLERLEVLSVRDCNSIEEIIEEETSSNSSGGSFDVINRMFSGLIKLQLEDLQKLKNIYQGKHILEWPALKDLYVKGCHKVEMLFASSELLESQQPIILVDHRKIVFPNLKTLKVEECDGLRNLVSLSTAKSQVKLARMEISNCKMIEKIIEMQVGEGVKEDPIVFSHVEYLKLDNLPTLESFCLENYTLKFPYLEQVIVSACPNMKIFSQGVLDTPMLHKVQLRDVEPWEEEKGKKREERWEGNLNSTIQKMFQGMDRFCGIGDLKLSKFPSLKEIWNGPALPVSFFSNLTSLVVDDCTFMSSAIPANLLRFLDSLRDLEVRNCDSVEEVFHLEDLNADKQTDIQLWTLKLVDLPKLKRFCNYTENIINLRWHMTMWIENCPNVETFISNSTPAHMTTNREPHERTSEENFLTDMQPFLNEKVAFPRHYELKLFKLPKLLHLWKENSHPSNVFKDIRRLEISECHKLRQLVPSSVTFECLSILVVSKCDGLINLAALSTAKSLANLTRMKVNDCKMIEEIIQQQVGEEAEKDCVVFNELQYLELSCLPSLTSFCLGNYTLEFPSLEHVFVKECPKMEFFSRGLLRTPKFQKLRLTELDSEEEVESDSEEEVELDSEEEERWEGSLNFAIQKLFQEMNSKEEN